MGTGYVKHEAMARILLADQVEMTAVLRRFYSAVLKATVQKFLFAAGKSRFDSNGASKVKTKTKKKRVRIELQGRYLSPPGTSD